MERWKAGIVGSKRDAAVRGRVRDVYRDAHERVYQSELSPEVISGRKDGDHAGIRPGVALEAQDPADLLWIREAFLNSTAAHGAVIVHGHTPVGEPEVENNRIGIDTGAFATGHLTCVVLEGASHSFLAT